MLEGKSCSNFNQGARLLCRLKNKQPKMPQHGRQNTCVCLFVSVKMNMPRPKMHKNGVQRRDQKRSAGDRTFFHQELIHPSTLTKHKDSATSRTPQPASHAFAQIHAAHKRRARTCAQIHLSAHMRSNPCIVLHDDTSILQNY